MTHHLRSIWRFTTILLKSTDIPIAAGILVGAMPLYVPPTERKEMARAIGNALLTCILRIIRLINDHGAASCTMIGLFFLVRGENDDALEHEHGMAAVHDIDDELPCRVGIAGAEVKSQLMTVNPVEHYDAPSIACMALPRADLLTPEQAGQLHLELLAGCETPKGLPRSITHCLAIADTGCATSMGNSEDHFKPGTLVKSQSKVVGVSGPMTLDRKGEFRYPMETNHGIRKWEEGNSILNKTCPYVLLALGRSSIEKGLSLTMPAWGGDGYMSFPNGVVVKLYNRNVLALRPLGYKPSPSAGIALSTKSIGIPEYGGWVAFISSGHRREGDVTDWGKRLGIKAPIVPFDPKICNGHDLTARRFVDLLIGAIDNSPNAKCLGSLMSIRCRTWSPAHHLSDAKGNPPDPPRKWPDHILGVPDENGDIPFPIAEGNTETEHAAEIALAVSSRGGFVLSETPTRRRRGSTHFDKHILDGCDDHAHMLDHPAWLHFVGVTGALEIPWDQCPDAPDPEAAPIKSSLWLATPNIAGAVKIEFGNHVCRHAAGTHKPLRGVDEDGFYMTASSKCENYHGATCRRIARCIQLYIDQPATARLPAFTPTKAEPVTVSAPHDEPDFRPPPEPPPDYEIAMANGAFRISSGASIIRGKHLPKSVVCYDFIHRSFVHAEDRRLKHLPDALSDADEMWVKAMAEHAFKPPCEGCLTGDSPRLGPNGELPRVEGLIFLDIMHVSVPCIFTGYKIIVGVTHAASRKRKTIRVGSKDQAHLAMEIILAFFNSVGKEVKWIHTDGANELKGSNMVPLARSKNIRITTTVKKSSRQNPQEPSWRASMAGTRKTLHAGNLPVGCWGAAWDDAEEGQSLIPSREPPHDCSLGRLLSTEGKTVKPTGSHRRPFGSLCYPVISERLPSGTLTNKAAHQTKRAILLGYSGGRSGDFEALGVQRSQPGYICWFPDTNATLVTNDVYICWRIQPGLERTAGGGWTIPASKIPFSSDAELEREKQRIAQADSPPLDVKPADTHEPITVDIHDEKQLPDVDPDLDTDRLDLTFGYPDEAKAAETETSDVPSRGGSNTDQPTPPAPTPKVAKRFLVPRNHYPEYPCTEHGGVGWEVTVVERKGAWSRCRFVGTRDDDVPWEDEWRRTTDLIDLESLQHTGGSTPESTPAELQPSVPDQPATSPNVERPAALEPTPTDVTLPVPGGDGSLREPTRPTRNRRTTDFYGNYATPALGALRDVAALARFDATSPRLTAATLAVDTSSGGHRFRSRIAMIIGSGRASQ